MAYNETLVKRWNAGIFLGKEKKIREYSVKIHNDNYSHLNKEQSRILNALREDGYCVTHVDKLLNSEERVHFESILKLYEKMSTSPEVLQRIRSINLQGTGGASEKPTEINIQQHFLGRKPILEDGLAQLYLTDSVLNILNSFYGQALKAYQFNAFVHPQIPHYLHRNNSQRWHKDPEDMHVLKVFMYANDVDKNNGAFEYVRKTQTGGAQGHLQEYRTRNRYPADGWVESHVSPDDIKTLTGKKGTIIFADTSGFHRGGYVKEGIRHMCQGVFLRPNTFHYSAHEPSKHNINNDEKKYDLSPLAEYAISHKFCED